MTVQNDIQPPDTLETMVEAAKARLRKAIADSADRAWLEYRSAHAPYTAPQDLRVPTSKYTGEFAWGPITKATTLIFVGPLALNLEWFPIKVHAWLKERFSYCAVQALTAGSNV